MNEWNFRIQQKYVLKLYNCHRMSCQVKKEKKYPLWTTALKSGISSGNSINETGMFVVFLILIVRHINILHANYCEYEDESEDEDTTARD
jgi:hypothetical protein